MKYSDARPLLKSGDLIAMTSRAPAFSSFYAFKIACVQAFTRSQFSHVAIVWVPPGGRVFLLEAVKPKVRIYPLSNALGEGEDTYYLPLTTDWLFAEEFALAHIGQDYSELKAIKGYFGPLTHGAETDCAEYVLEVLRAAGVDLGTVATPSAVVRHAQLQGAPCTLITNPESTA